MQWTIVHLLPKPQMSESRSSTICLIVERPDQHCGDDLVTCRLYMLCTLYLHTIDLPNHYPDTSNTTKWIYQISSQFQPTFSCPFSQARSNGVLRRLLKTVGSAPFCSSNSTYDKPNDNNLRREKRTIKSFKKKISWCTFQFLQLACSWRKIRYWKLCKLINSRHYDNLLKGNWHPFLTYPLYDPWYQFIVWVPVLN